MQTIRQYAESRGISYEAVRRQIVEVYPEELKEHIQVIGATKYIDDEAEMFLDSKRSKSTVIVESTQHVEEIARLKKENEELKEKVFKTTDSINFFAENYKKLEERQLLLSDLENEKQKLNDENRELAAVNMDYFVHITELEKENEELEKEKENLKKELEKKEHELQEAENQRKQLEYELEQLRSSYEKTIFGLYKLKK